MYRTLFCLLVVATTDLPGVAQVPQIAWQQVYPALSDHAEWLNSLAATEDRLVAVGGTPFYLGGPVGSSAVLSSTDGYQWQVSLTNLDRQLTAVAFGLGQWVVSGDGGLLFTSADTTNWVDRSFTNTLGNPGNLLNLVFGNGRFIALPGFRDLEYCSTNGVDWNTIEVPDLRQVQRVSYVNGIFLAGGTNGNVLISTNGLDWDVRKTPTDSWLGASTYGKGRYVIGGYLCLLYSFDAVDWKVVTVPISVRDITYANGWFIAVGALGPEMLVSPDGVHWEAPSVVPPSDFGLDCVAYAQDAVMVATGKNLYRGVITEQDGYKTRIHRLGTGQLEYWGGSGFEYRLETSSDLKAWQSAPDWRSGTGDYLLWDENSPESPCFWRVAIRPAL